MPIISLPQPSCTSQSIWCWSSERQTTDTGNLICSTEGNKAEQQGIKTTKPLGRKLEGTSFRMLNGVSPWIKHKTVHKLLINVENVLRNTENNYEKCQTQPSWHLHSLLQCTQKWQWLLRRASILAAIAWWGGVKNSWSLWKPGSWFIRNI